MICALRGRLLSRSPDRLIVDVGGVGYGVRTPLSTFFELERLDHDSEVSLLVHTHVRDDAIELFGFLTELELGLFELLISVSGVGPKLAQGVLSGLEPPTLAAALANGDVAQLVRIPGIGKKTAERLVLELRERVAKQYGEVTEVLSPESSDGGPSGSRSSDEADAVSALLALGYRAREAEKAVAAARAQAGDEELDLQELLRAALRQLAKV